MFLTGLSISVYSCQAASYGVGGLTRIIGTPKKDLGSLFDLDQPSRSLHFCFATFPWKWNSTRQKETVTLGSA
jgi:hypothetical protein